MPELNEEAGQKAEEKKGEKGAYPFALQKEKK